MLIDIDPNWLVNEIVYQDYTGTNDFGQDEHGAPVEIQHVRYDDKPTFIRTASQLEQIGNAIIFCVADFITGIDIKEFKEQGLVTFEGKEHVIKAINKYYSYADQSLYSVELVVI